MAIHNLSDNLWRWTRQIGNMLETVQDTVFGRHVVQQLLDCFPLIAARYTQALASEEPEQAADAIAQILEDLEETRRWLQVAYKTGLIDEARGLALDESTQALHEELTELLFEASSCDHSTDESDLKPQETTQQRTQQSKSDLGRIAGCSGLDHVAVLVRDTDEALRVWRDTLGFQELYQEVVQGGAVRLTHLDLGNTHLQLVQPLTPEHPLQAVLERHGPMLHHLCLRVDNVQKAVETAPVRTGAKLHQGTRGKRAVFLDTTSTQGVQVELTGS